MWSLPRLARAEGRGVGAHPRPCRHTPATRTKSDIAPALVHDQIDVTLSLAELDTLLDRRQEYVENFPLDPPAGVLGDELTDLFDIQAAAEGDHAGINGDRAASSG